MELNKTKCLDCGFINSWYGYKWANDEYRQNHNRVNATTCIQCNSTNVTNQEDAETMGFYHRAAGSIIPDATAPEHDTLPPPDGTTGTDSRVYKLKLVLGNLYAAERLIGNSHPAHAFLMSAIGELKKL